LTTTSVLQARRAEQAEQQAQARRQQAEDVLSFMLGEFADKLRPIGRLELLDSVGGKALKVLDRAGVPSAADRLQRAKALTVIGEVRISKRDLDAALEPLKAADELLQGDPPSPDLTASWRKAQGAAAFWLGEVAFRQRQSDPAERYWQRYRHVSEQWLQALPKDTDAQLELSYAENSLGSLQMRRGLLAQAESAFRQSFALKDALVRLHPDDAALRRDWSDTASWLGSALIQQGRYRSAATELERALAGIQTLRRSHPEDLAWLASEASVGANLGRARLAIGRQDPALWALAGEAASRVVRSDPVNLQWAFMALEIEADRVEQMPDSAERSRRAQALLARLEGLRSGKPPLDSWLFRSVKLLALMASPSCRGEACGGLQEAMQRTERRLTDAVAKRPEDLMMRDAAVQLQLIKAGLAAGKAAGRPACLQARALLSAHEGWLQVHADLTQHWLAVEQCLDPAAAERSDCKAAQAWLVGQRDR
jgi:eukaryotic-like serine/threonine-protein kinase